MSATKNIAKPKTSPVLLNLLVRVHQAGRVTTNDLKTETMPQVGPYMDRLVKDGLVKAVAVVKSGKRGRPANVYAVTDKGRGRAKRAAVKVETTEA